MITVKYKMCLTLYCLLFLILSPVISPAVTYYIDKNHATANDNNPGTLDSPWLTILHAAETLVAGDTVFIRNGVYNEHLYFDHNGDATNGHIVYSAYPGETPVLDGTGVEESGNGMNLDKSYIKLIGLEVRNWPENAIWIENSAFLEISDCEIHNVYYGIGIADGSHDFEINRVTVHHFDLYGFDVSPSGGADSYNGVFNDCVAHTGRDRQQNVDGFALGHGTQHTFQLNRCITYDVFDGFDISSRETTLNRCLAYNCWNGGYKLWQDNLSLVNCIGYNSASSVVELDWDGNPGAVTLMNCTFFNGATYTIWVENAADTLKMYNCIIAGGDNIGLAFEQRSVGNYVGDYNLFQNDDPNRMIVVGYEDEFSLDQVKSGAWSGHCGQDNHTIVTNLANNIFVDPVLPDLHLTASSPAINKGTNSGAPAEDYDGHHRPQGSGTDIGAYEYQGSSYLKNNGRLQKIPQNIKLYPNYPNPFNPETTIEFELNRPGFAELKICDICGREVRILTSEEYKQGIYKVKWNGLDNNRNRVASGLFIYTLNVNGLTESGKLLLIR